MSTYLYLCLSSETQSHKLAPMAANSTLTMVYHLNLTQGVNQCPTVKIFLLKQASPEQKLRSSCFCQPAMLLLTHRGSVQPSYQSDPLDIDHTGIATPRLIHVPTLNSAKDTLFQTDNNVRLTLHYSLLV